jgi:hypothetical protein
MLMDHHGGAAVKVLEVVKRCYPGESGGKSGKSYEYSRNVKIPMPWFSSHNRKSEVLRNK